MVSAVPIQTPVRQHERQEGYLAAYTTSTRNGDTCTVMSQASVPDTMCVCARVRVRKNEERKWLRGMRQEGVTMCSMQQDHHHVEPHAHRSKYSVPKAYQVCVCVRT